jgi:hypothetical protein
MLPADFSDAPIDLTRRGLNFLVRWRHSEPWSGAAAGAVFGYLIYKGIGTINWAF